MTLARELNFCICFKILSKLGNIFQSTSSSAFFLSELQQKIKVIRKIRPRFNQHRAEQRAKTKGKPEGDISLVKECLFSAGTGVTCCSTQQHLSSSLTARSRQVTSGALCRRLFFSTLMRDRSRRQKVCSWRNHCDYCLSWWSPRNLSLS